MDTILTDLINKYQIFLFILVRVTGIFIISPIFSRRNIPNILKICFCVLLSFVLLNTVETDYVSSNIIDFVIVIFKELCLGLFVGFISHMFLTSLYVAGQIIDTQIGFGMVNVFDPQSNSQVPIIGTFYNVLAILVFLTINGHHYLIKALVSSYDYISIGQFAFTKNVITQIIDILGQTFIIGFKISGPILATIFIADVLLGILARTVPQMNVFVVGMPLKIIAGFFVLVASLPLIVVALQHIFSNMNEEIFEFLKLIHKG